jgi:lactate/malate dehydrogenase family protein
VSSIVILGAGELGGALGRQLACADVTRRIVLVDESASSAEGKALDIRQAAPIDGYSTVVSGSSDESAVLGADFIVIADRAATGVEWQGDSGVALVRRLAYLNPNSVILCAGAAQMDLVERGIDDGGLRRDRLFGSAPEGLRSAVAAMTALEAGCSATDISVAIVGRPPAEIIVPWDEAAIGGRRAIDVLSPPAIVRLDARLPRLWPPGPLTLASAATRVVVSATRRSHEAVCLFVALSRDESPARRVGVLPAHVTEAGISHLLTPTLSTRDRVRLDTALQR